MPNYTVQDQTTGKKITFEWSDPNPPTDKDMEEIFSQAGTVKPQVQPTQPQPVTSMQAGNVPSKKEPWYGEYLSQGPRTIGGILGGIAGTPFAPPFGTLAGISFGSMAGELLEQGRKYAVSKGVFRQPSETEQMRAPQSISQAAWEVGKAGIEEPAYQLAGAGVIKGFGKVLAPFAKKLSSEAQGTIDFLKDRIKPVLTPAEATESRGLDILENIAEGSLLGGGQLSKFKLNRQRVLNDMVDDIVDRFGKRVSPEELGETFEKVVENKWKGYKKAVIEPLYTEVERLTKPIYGQVEKRVPRPSTILDISGKPMVGETIEQITKQVGGPIISTRSLKEFAKPLAKISGDLGNIEAKNAGDDLVRAVLDLPDNVEFQVAKELRSRLISRVDEFSVINKKAPAIGKAKQFIKLIDQETEEGLSPYPEALSLWREANRLYVQGEKQFNNAFIRRLIKKADPDFGGEPEAIGKIVFRPGAIGYVKQVKAATDPATFKQFQSYYLQNLLSKSVDDSGNIIGDKMLQNMYGKSGTGDNVLRELFDLQTLDNITKFAKAAKVSQMERREHIGKIWIQLSQAGAAANLGFGGPGQEISGIIVLGPPILSRALL
ncbi:MAG: hypothetical protein KKB31_01600, partial [Nanoarchaeota archaeon]|nr:hypothetical protein [Nanoarchaeota archaeon]